MLTPERRTKILTLALPIVGGMLSQNVLNLVDTAMVGRLGDAAIAAVNIGAFANFGIIALVTGLSTGVQAIASRRIGEGRNGETAIPLNGGLFIALVAGIPLTILALVIAPYVVPLINGDEQVIDMGVSYWQIRATVVIAVGMNFCFRGFWNAIYRPKLYLRTLLLMHSVNIVLNYAFIFGVEPLGIAPMGTDGAAIGTAVSTVVGTCYYFLLGFQHARPSGFMASLPNRETLGGMLHLAMPTMAQQLFFALGMNVFMVIVGLLGVPETAATGVLINLLLTAVLPGIAFGIAASTFVGDSLGQKDPEAAREWGWDVAKMGGLVVGAFTLPAAFFPELLLSPFLVDPATRELARVPLILLAVSMPLDTVGLVLMNAHNGAGATRRSMLVTIFMQWGLGLGAAYLLGPVIGFGLVGVWIGQSGYRALQALVFALSWAGDSWTDIKV